MRTAGTNLCSYTFYFMRDRMDIKLRRILSQTSDSSRRMEIALFDESSGPNTNWNVTNGTCHRLKGSQKLIRGLLDLMRYYICLYFCLLRWQ